MNLCSDPFCSVCLNLEHLYRESHPKAQVSRQIAAQTSSEPVSPPQRCYSCSATLLDDPMELILAQYCFACGYTNVRSGFKLTQEGQ